MERAQTLPIEDVTVTCLCVVNDSVWLGDSRAIVHIYGLVLVLFLTIFPIVALS